MGQTDSLGIIANRLLEGESHAALLAVEEREQYERFIRQDRRAQWLGGRLAAKHLILTRLGLGDTVRPEAWPPTPRKLDGTDLQLFPDWAYREIKILSNCGADRRFHEVRMGNRAQGVRISLAHTATTSAAVIDSWHLVGLDIEVPRKRSQAFYRVSFSGREKHWANRLAHSGPEIDRDVGYTILWCLKEAVLKSHVFGQLSLWQLAGVEVIPGKAADLADSWIAGRSGEPMLVTQIEARFMGSLKMGEAALLVAPQAVLTIVRFRQEGK